MVNTASNAQPAVDAGFEVPRLLTLSGAAAYCGMSASTYRRHMHDGRLPTPLSQFNRIDRVAIDAAIARTAGNTRTKSGVSARSEIAAWRNTKLRKEASNDQ